MDKKLKLIVEDMINKEKNETTVSLANIIWALSTPIRVGWEARVRDSVFTQDEVKDILHIVWPKIMSEDEWSKMIEIDGKINPKEYGEK